ncbi:MAG: hypothetical protein AABZ60_13500 [Planctomycetota bacterium]
MSEKKITQPAFDERIIFINLLHLYGRILIGLTLFGMGIQLFLHWKKIHWSVWPVSQFSCFTYSCFNILVFFMMFLLFNVTPWMWTRPWILKRILPYLYKKQTTTENEKSEKRPLQRVLLILFFLENSIRFSFPFLSALFAIFVLMISSLNLQLHFQKIYWLNILPVYFFLGLILGGKPNINAFQYWRFQYIKLIRSFLKILAYDKKPGDTPPQSS